MIDEADDQVAEEGAEKQAPSPFQQQLTRQLFFLLALLLVNVALLAGAFSILMYSTGSLQTMLENLPFNRMQTIQQTIEDTYPIIEEQYQPYTDQFNDPSLTDITGNYRVLFNAANASEQALLASLEVYQKSIYRIASQVRGSGAWYEYYRQRMQSAIDLTSARNSSFQQQFGVDEKSTDSELPQ